MSEIPQTRASLLMRLGDASHDAWPEFLQVYEQALYRFCRSKSLQPADAEDAIQDVLTAVMKKIPDWDPDANRGSFRSWLFAVARNITVDVVNRRTKKVHATGDSGVAKDHAQRTHCFLHPRYRFS